MILTLIFVGLLVLGIILMTLDEQRFGIDVDLDIIGSVLTSFSVIASMGALLVILVAHAGVTNEIEKNRIEYESLVARQEIVRSEYEDVSKSDVVKDIAEWNRMVQSNKYWGYNPWTNWFYSRRKVDELKFIE